MYKNTFFRYSTVFLFLSFLTYFSWFLSETFQFNSQKEVNQSSILFILDVSKSMDAQDVYDADKSISRLNASKKFIKDFIKKHPNNEFSLQIFAWDTLSVFPFTFDIDAFLTTLDGIDSASLLNGWNDINKAFEEAVESFQNNKVSGWIIVLSDFEFPKKSQAEIQKYYQNLKEFNQSQIKVYTVWVWNDEWSAIPLAWNPEIPSIFAQTNYLIENGKRVITRYDADSQKTFSQITQAIQLYLSDTKDISKNLWNFWDIPSQKTQITQKNNLDFIRISATISAIFFVLFLGSTYFERRKKYKI